VGWSPGGSKRLSPTSLNVLGTRADHLPLEAVEPARLDPAEDPLLECVSSDEALAMGLITRVVDDAELATAAPDVARVLSRRPARALSSACALII